MNVMKQMQRAWGRFVARFKSWVLRTTVKVLRSLEKIGLVKEHKNFSRIPTGSRNSVLPVIASPRFSFEVYCTHEDFINCNEHWFETKKGGKRLYTLDDRREKSVGISLIARLYTFVARIDHEREVHLNAVTRPFVDVPIIPKFVPVELVTGDDPLKERKLARPEMEIIRADIAGIMFRFNRHLSVRELEYFGESLEAITNRMWGELKNDLNNKIAEINELVTGVKNDGALTSARGQVLAENRVCSLCSHPVFFSAVNNKRYECIHDGELEELYVDKVDPVTYQNLFKNCFSALEEFCCRGHLQPYL